VSSEKNKLRHSRKTVSTNEKWNYMLTRLSDNLFKFFGKMSRPITRTRHRKYSFAVSAH